MPPGRIPEAIKEEPDRCDSHRDGERLAVALEFCRECLGWPEASGSGGRSLRIVENKRRSELSHAYSKLHGFHLDPGDFSHVINAVKEWCDTNGVGFSLEYSPRASPKDSWRARLAPYAETQGDDPCAALLRACLAANRHVAQHEARRTQVDAITEKHNPAILANPWGNIRENAKIALAFCKECLGWRDAYISTDFGYVYVKESVPKHLAATPIFPWERSFHFNENHVDRVMAAVKTWCDARALGFLLEYFPSASANDCWRTSVDPDSQAHGDLASSALMSSCITADRHIKAQEQKALPGDGK